MHVQFVRRNRDEDLALHPKGRVVVMWLLCDFGQGKSEGTKVSKFHRGWRAKRVLRDALYIELNVFRTVLVAYGRNYGFSGEAADA